MERANNDNKGIRPGLLLAMVAVVAVLVAAKFAGFLGGSKTTETAGGSTPAEPPAAEAPASPKPAMSPPPRPPARPATVPVPVAPPAGAPVAGTPGAAEPVADWSGKLDNILGGSEAEAAKADRLLAMWPSLPPDGQIEVMQHITNLLPDDKFNLLHNTFTNATTHEEVLDVLMTDALNRPNGIKLPALLDVAKTPGHPKAEEAKEILEVFVDANHGADWPKWEKAVQDWLKENPDEGPDTPEPK